MRKLRQDELMIGVLRRWEDFKRDVGHDVERDGEKRDQVWNRQKKGQKKIMIKTNQERNN